MTPTREVKRARMGVTIMFWLNGVGISSIIPRYPEIKTALGLGDLPWGLAIALGPLGGLVAGLFTAALIRRYASANVSIATTLISLVTLLLLASASHWAVFALALTFVAALDSLADIAMNAHGLRVQKHYSRSILIAMHGWWSVGAVCGGVIGATAAQLGIPLLAQTLVTSAIFIAIAFYGRSILLPGPDAAPAPDVLPEGQPGRGIPLRWLPRLVALGLLGASAGLIEDSGASWGGVYMDTQFAVAPFMVGMAFVALQAMQMIGRFTGDALTNRIGSRAAVTQGLIIACVGMGLAVAWPSPVATLIGFGCAGWGVANAIPAAMNSADELPGLLHGNGLTFVTWLMRLGFFVGPPLIGLFAEATTLRWALLVIPATALVGLLLSPALTPPREAA